MTPHRPTRELALTPDHVARATRPVADFAYPSAFCPATDADYAALVERLIAEKREGTLHIFAYGSLIWSQPFEPVARRRAVAWGWHRQFCLETRGHRGTPETPGLMMALMSGAGARDWRLRLRPVTSGGFWRICAGGSFLLSRPWRTGAGSGSTRQKV